MLEGKALVVAIMMLTAAPLVVTDDGRAIVGDVTSDVTDMFTVEEAAEDPKLDELLDDAVDKSELSELEKERKQAEVVTKEEEKECYFLDEAKEMMGDKEGKDWDKEDKDWDKEDKDWDKEDKDEWESEEDFEAYLEKLSQDCEEGVEESCEELEVIREEASLLVSRLRNDIAYAELQYSLGTLYSSVGMTFVPNNIAQISDDELAVALKDNLNRWTKSYNVFVNRPINEQNPILEKTDKVTVGNVDSYFDFVEYKFEFDRLPKYIRENKEKFERWLD